MNRLENKRTYCTHRNKVGKQNKTRMMLQRWALFCGLWLPVLFAYASTSNNQCPDHSPPVVESASWDQLFKLAALQFGSTVEILLRSFALGFGAHLLQYLFFVKNLDVTYDELAGRFKVSAVCGLAMACFVFGSSFFIPTQFRMNWFEY
jgi:hypothetical protein